MKMNKKLITMLAALGLVGCVGVGSTLAYLTATTDPVVNTFTVGNVSIELIESQLHRSNASGEPTQDTPSMADQLVEASDYSKAHGWNDKYYPDEVILKDAETYKEGYFAEAAKDIVPGRSVRKCPYVVNTGSTEAYVRVRAYIPANLDPKDNGILGNTSYWCTTAWKNGETILNGVAYDKADSTCYDRAIANLKTKEIDGVVYTEMVFTYAKPLAAGDMTFWQAWNNFEIGKNVTAEDLKGIEEFNVIFEADAIQSEGFADALTAFAAFDGAKKN